MILASHQPDFAPYPGFFYKMFKSDVFVLSDDVGYSNSEMHKYNFIQGANGKQRIGLPVEAHIEGKPIKNVRVARDDRMIEKAVKSFEQAYRKHPFFDKYGRFFINIMLSASTDMGSWLTEVNTSIIMAIANGFGFKANVVEASRLFPGGRKDERIISLCRIMKADTYISGYGAAAYHDPKKFDDAGIRLTYSNYRPIVYPQYGNRGDFIENLSMIDYVMNCGYELPSEWR